VKNLSKLCRQNGQGRKGSGASAKPESAEIWGGKEEPKTLWVLKKQPQKKFAQRIKSQKLKGGERG